MANCTRCDDPVTEPLEPPAPDALVGPISFVGGTAIGPGDRMPVVTPSIRRELASARAMATNVRSPLDVPIVTA